jgi:hypothetical protein
MDERDIWKRREGKGWGIQKKMLYLVFVRIVISV